MPIPRELFPFTARLIAGAPEEPGVYVLWEDGEITYIGHAQGRGATIRSRLVDHFSGTHSPCTRRATHYSWEISLKPAAREAALLEEYQQANARLPRCNAR
jgi:excinuclease UvrABC nuclease subunit